MNNFGGKLENNKKKLKTTENNRNETVETTE